MSDNNQSGRFYSLQEVSAQCGLAPYILRYWELHFPELTADDSKPKHMYNASDIQLVNRIKKLLYVEHLTIEQAKGRLKKELAFPVDYTVKAAQQTVVGNQQQEPEAPVEPVAEEPEEAKSVEQTMQPVETTDESPVVEEAATAENQVAADAPAESAAMPMDEIHQAAAAELASLRSEVESLKAQVEAERTKAQSAQDLLAAEVAKVLNLTQALDGERSRSLIKEQESAYAGESLASVRSELDSVKQQLTEAKAQLEQAGVELTAKESELEAFRQQSQQALDNARVQSEQLTKLAAENEMLRERMAGFVSQLKDLSTVLAKAK